MWQNQQNYDIIILQHIYEISLSLDICVTRLLYAVLVLIAFRDIQNCDALNL